MAHFSAKKKFKPVTFVKGNCEENDLASDKSCAKDDSNDVEIVCAKEDSRLQAISVANGHHYMLSRKKSEKAKLPDLSRKKPSKNTVRKRRKLETKKKAKRLLLKFSSELPPLPVLKELYPGIENVCVLQDRASSCYVYFRDIGTTKAAWEALNMTKVNGQWLNVYHRKMQEKPRTKFGLKSDSLPESAIFAEKRKAIDAEKQGSLSTRVYTSSLDQWKVAVCDRMNLSQESDCEPISPTQNESSDDDGDDDDDDAAAAAEELIRNIQSNQKGITKRRENGKLRLE